MPDETELPEEQTPETESSPEEASVPAEIAEAEEVPAEEALAETPEEPETPGPGDEPVESPPAEIPEEPVPVAPTAVDELPPLEAPPGESRGVSWVPFSVYLFAWVALAVATVVVLREAAVSGGALWAAEYAYTVFGGIALAVAGPILSLVVWLVARAGRAPGDRKGLLAGSLLLGAGAAFLGTMMWLLALYVLDLYRAGVLS